VTSGLWISLEHGEDYRGLTGGAGGAGGCPALAGAAGKGGGASVAILAFESPFRLESSMIASGRGGDGGAAGFSSRPTFGSAGGSAPNDSEARNGAPGGRGGNAGASGSGAGGPSFGIVHQGGVPNYVGSTINVQPGGRGVPPRAKIDRPTTLESPDGMSAAVYAL
jgi:hypothetical protein